MRILTLLICCGTMMVGTVWANPQPLDGVAAVVNNAIITKSELRQQTKLIEKQIEESGNTLPDEQTLQRQVLDHLILKEVQHQMAKRTGITVTETSLDNAIANIAKQNHMTLTELREALSREGIDYDNYRSNVRHQIEINQLQQRDIISDIHISEQEINQFLQSPNGMGGSMNEYRLSHILVPLSDSPSPEELDAANQKTQEIMNQLREGKDFAQVAFAESTGEQALNGGDLGWRKLPELPTIFEKVVTTLQINQVPEPIRSSSGFHIIMLMDKRIATQSENVINKTLVRHILIKPNTNISESDAYQKIMEIKQKIDKGGDFAQLAKSNSADLASAGNGGSLGWVTGDVLVPEFSEQMDKLALQEVSEPFQTSFGWHIVQVLDRKSQATDETLIRQKAKEMLQQRRFEEKREIWSRQLLDEAYIKRYLDA